MSGASEDEVENVSEPVTAPGVSPGRILDLTWGIARTGTLVAALDLDLFTLIDRGDRTMSALCRATGASERGMDTLVTVLVRLGLVQCDRDGCFTLAEDAATYLVAGKPNYLGDMRQVHRVLSFPLWPCLTETVLSGKAPIELFGNDASDVWKQVTPYFDALADTAAQWLSGRLRPLIPEAAQILDVGCGTGGYGRMLVRNLPATHVVGLDRAGMVTVAETRAIDAGMSTQLDYRSGDLRTMDWGDGYHLVLLSNLLHGYPDQVCAELLARARAALVPGGVLAIFEMVPDLDQPMDNPAASFFGLQMLLESEGTAYHEYEYCEWLERAGFRQVRSERCPAGHQTLLTAAAQ
jgi:SAM-dependent methyltransferase